MLITITIGTFDLINFVHYNIIIATGKEKDNETFLIYTKHSRKRIKQRNLKIQQIEETVIKPDKILPSFKGRSLAQKTSQDKC